MCFLVWALIVYVLYVCLFFVCFLLYFTTFVANKHIIFFHAKFQLHQYTALPIWGEELLKNYDFNQFASLWAPMPALSSITAKSGMSEWTQNVLYMLNFALINSVASAWCKTWNDCSTSKGVTTALMTMTGMHVSWLFWKTRQSSNCSSFQCGEFRDSETGLEQSATHLWHSYNKIANNTLWYCFNNKKYKESGYSHLRKCEYHLMLFALTGVNILWSSTCNSSFFLSVMPPKDLAPFSYISPQKNPLFNDKLWTYYRILVSKLVKSQKTEKRTHPETPLPRLQKNLTYYCNATFLLLSTKCT